ncbi:MAG: tRNA (N6-isopentenyl adenosine(37)-C2)-methylthiotransferase MiaB, partial [Synergistaceae bacterium]|nr:tRNA (N6-isopentenyl adenosine(37)-C2)-methylthiotransferase MiaB [Synergistaceae bacterium]
MIKFCMKVYGCQMNVYDSDKVKNNLLLKGWNEISPEREEEADLIIITGCSVRAKAEQKVWSELGRYDKFKRRPVLALTGCIAQSLGKRALTRFDWVKLVSGPRHIGLLPDALEKVMNERDNSKLKINLLDENPREFFDLDEVTIKRDNKYKAYVTIAHGCDNFCTYCIVPYVRGRFLSRKPEDILREIKILVDDGVREVTLLGQNVNSYGKDLGDINFAELLRRVAKIDGLDLIRFVTSLPQDFTREIAEVMASDEKICPSLNLPVQNGSDRILKLMNRKYTRAEYLDKVNMIRSLLPELGLTTDLIVGFPSETEQDFEDSLSILREVKFDMVHSAAYSE